MMKNKYKKKNMALKDDSDTTTLLCILYYNTQLRLERQSKYNIYNDIYMYYTNGRWFVDALDNCKQKVQIYRVMVHAIVGKIDPASFFPLLFFW